VWGPASTTSHAVGQISAAIDSNAWAATARKFPARGGKRGTTGSGVEGEGGAPVIAKNLKRIYTEPVYGLGILPGSNEGGSYTLNAARSLKTFVDEVDNLMLFDNDAWRSSGESVEEGFDAINEELVQRFGVLFSAGEITEGSDIAESVVDSSEIINTLKGGGISSLGYADVEVDEPERKGLLSRLRGDMDAGIDSTEATNRITSLVRKATLGRLTFPCEVKGTERALLVVAGPPEYLNRKGIEHGRKWLEEQTGSMEVRGGDYPRRGEGTVAAARHRSRSRYCSAISKNREKSIASNTTGSACCSNKCSISCRYSSTDLCSSPNCARNCSRTVL